MGQDTDGTIGRWDSKQVGWQTGGLAGREEGCRRGRIQAGNNTGGEGYKWGKI